MKQLIYITSFITLTAALQFCHNGNAQPNSQPAVAGTDSTTEYVCLPCGSACDSIILSGPGTCQHCQMQLVKKSSVVFNTISPAGLYQYMMQKGRENIVLLDVRTPEEFNGTAEEKFGRLQNAINIPVQALKQRITELEKYKNKEIIVYCSHSHRSPQASYLLTQNGFTHVSNLQYGMHMWKQQVTDTAGNKLLFVPQ
jgi:rhodanese-related sulfurtransferase/DNA-directed RNA polymerase subunit RPC12/RpoP